MKIWRRFHSHELIANILQRDAHTFVVAVWHTASEKGAHYAREFRKLDSAKAAADHLLRRTFGHRCSFEECGTWILWST